MSSERETRQRVVRALRPLHAISIENGAGVGTPDVNFADGWIELKSIDRWPARADTPLRVNHFSPAQRAWLRRRAAAGGHVWLLLKVADDWLLFEGSVAADVVGTSCRAELLKWSCALWLGGLDEADLRKFLCQSR